MSAARLQLAPVALKTADGLFTATVRLQIGSEWLLLDYEAVSNLIMTLAQQRGLSVEHARSLNAAPQLAELEPEGRA